jgi:hypothetical protein
VDYLIKVHTKQTHNAPHGASTAHEEVPFAHYSSSHADYATDTDTEGDVWYELRDDATGTLYYFCTATGVSQWEPPHWFDEVDPASGATYYRDSVTGETQWERPVEFLPVIRAEAYSTPEAEYIKSMLSPHRSFRQQGKHFSFKGQASPDVVM